jgi:hypothetical protein
MKKPRFSPSSRRVLTVLIGVSCIAQRSDVSRLPVGADAGRPPVLPPPTRPGVARRASSPGNSRGPRGSRAALGASANRITPPATMETGATSNCMFLPKLDSPFGMTLGGKDTSRTLGRSSRSSVPVRP